MLQSLCEEGIHLENPTDNYRHQVSQLLLLHVWVWKVIDEVVSFDTVETR